jgi:hypothetical protein
MRIISLLPALCLCWSQISWAQPTAPEAPAQPVVEEPPPPVPPAPSPVPPAPAVDSQEVVTLFDQAIEALIQGRFDAAARGFEEVARQSVELERRSAANELARQAQKRMQLTPVASTKSGEGPALEDEEDGRAAFLSTTIVLGLNYGWMVPLILDVDDAKAFVGLSLLTAGAAFTVPYLLTKDDEITRGMATLGSSGAAFGFAHGALAYLTVVGIDDVETRPLLATMLGTSMVEGTLGYIFAKDQKMSAARALALSSGSLWGLGLTGGTNFLLTGEDTNPQVAYGTMLLGSAAGAYAGFRYEQARRPTDGDVSIVSYTGLLGGYTALAPLLAADVENPRVIAGSLMGGALLGLAGGDHLLKGRDYTRSAAGVISLGSLAGGLLGAGGAFLVTPEDGETATWIVTGSAAGAIGGLVLMLSAFDDGRPEPAADENGVAMQLTPIIGEQGETGLGLSGAF